MSAPDSGIGGHVFLSRKERRAFEAARSHERLLAQGSMPVPGPAHTQAPVQDPVQLRHASTQESFADLVGGAVPAETRHRASAPDPFAGLFDPTGTDPRPRAHEPKQSDVRTADGRGNDPRRGSELALVPRLGGVSASTQTGRVRVRSEGLARATDSAPLPLTLPTASESDGVSELFGGMSDAPQVASASRRASRSAASGAPLSRPRGTARAGKGGSARAKAGKPVTTTPIEWGPTASGPAKTKVGLRRRPKAARTRVAVSASARRRSPLARLLAKAGIMVAALGLVATTAVPAYAQFDTRTWIDPGTGKVQTLAVGAVQSVALNKDDYAAHTTSAALDSTMGTVVAPEVEALAQQLMAAVQQGRLVGSTPDHIFEIRYLAAGQARPGCGVDYRVLQAIAFALTQFNTVGVSDINRHCTGQIEGAGTASAHYADGGGHAVDFYRLNGQSLTGGDSSSIRLIEALDAVVPTGSTVGQMQCRGSLPLMHFKQIDDTCDHVHVDFLDAKAATLLG